MEECTELSRTLSIPACSFKCMRHPEYEAIKAACEPWLLALAAPATPAAVRFWQDSSLPLLASFCFAQCPKKRAILCTKMLCWFTVSDNADDDISARGSDVTDHVRRRHELIIACFRGGLPGGENITPEFSSLQEIWKEISEDMSLTMQSRYLEAVSLYLRALKVQSQYRNAASLPGVGEYVNVVRNPASIVLQLLILLEYGLGIELDEETLGSDLMLQLHETVVSLIALYNDLFSYEAEIFSGDYFNLPSVIFHAAKAAQPAFTFTDAVQEAVRMVEEVDKLCVQVMAEVERSSLVEKPGVKAYLRGLVNFMAGSIEWSTQTARYTHSCSKEGLVLPVVRTLSLPSAAPPSK